MSRDPKASYYDVGGIETVDFQKAKLSPDMYQGYLLGCILKYASRCLHKGEYRRDVNKIFVYAKLLLEGVKEEDERNDKRLTPSNGSFDSMWGGHTSPSCSAGNNEPGSSESVAG